MFMRSSLLAILLATATAHCWADEQAAGVQRVEFVTPDDDHVKIIADFYPVDPARDKHPPVAILLHMYQADRKTWEPLARTLQNSGVAALALDLRGHGESLEPASANLAARVESRERKIFADMNSDIQGGYAWLAENTQVDLARFALVGASVGCTVAFSYAADDPSVDVIVGMSPGTKYMKIMSVPDMKNLTERDVLLVGEEKDTANINEFKTANPRLETEIVATPSADANIHGTKMFGQVEGVEKRITEFIEGKLVASDEVVVADIRRKVYFPADSEKAEKVAAEKKRLFSSTDEAEARGMREEGKAQPRGAMGAASF